MSFKSNTFYTLTSLFYLLTFWGMFNIGHLIFFVESGEVTMNNSVRDQMYGYFWYLAAALPLLIIKKRDASYETQTTQQRFTFLLRVLNNPMKIK